MFKINAVRSVNQSLAEQDEIKLSEYHINFDRNIKQEIESEEEDFLGYSSSDIPQFDAQANKILNTGSCENNASRNDITEYTRLQNANTQQTDSTRCDVSQESQQLVFDTPIKQEQPTSDAQFDDSRDNMGYTEKQEENIENLLTLASIIVDHNYYKPNTMAIACESFAAAEYFRQALEDIKNNENDNSNQLANLTEDIDVNQESISERTGTILPQLPHSDDETLSGVEFTVEISSTRKRSKHVAEKTCQFEDHCYCKSQGTKPLRSSSETVDTAENQQIEKPKSSPVIKMPPKRQFFQCIACEKSCMSRKMYMAHIRTHNNSRNLECKSCSQIVPTYKELRKHKTFHDIRSTKMYKKNPHLKDRTFDQIRNRLKCSVCEKFYLVKSAYLIHMVEHDPSDNIKCAECDLTFPNMIDFIDHVKEHNIEFTLKHACSQCKSRFWRSENLYMHMIRTHASKVCGICYKLFETINELDIHLDAYHVSDKKWPQTTPQLHENPMLKPYACGFCGKQFADPMNLKTHITNHEMELNECQLCAVRCNSLFDYMNHIKVHQGTDQRYFCETCSNSYKTIDHLKLHLAMHDRISEIRHGQICCEICQMRFAKRKHLVYHQLKCCKRNPKNVKDFGTGIRTDHINNDEERIKVEYNVAETITVPNLYDDRAFAPNPLAVQTAIKDHQNTSDNTDPDYTLDKKTILKEEQKTSTSETDAGHLKCSKCSDLFKEQSMLDYHLNVHEVYDKALNLTEGTANVSIQNDRIYNCGICDRSFMSWRILEIHAAVHRNAKQRKCRLCGKSFFGVRRLQRHRKTDHPPEEIRNYYHFSLQNYICDICGQIFTSKIRIRRHFKSHRKETRKLVKLERTNNLNTCGMCFRTFRNFEVFEEHMKKHLEDNLNFSCSVCRGSFQTVARLNRHMSHHREAKVFQCEDCKKRFFVEDLYHEHMYTHTGEKHFQCDLCSRQFHAKFLYIRHRKTHTNDSAFSCSVCQKKFSTEARMKDHENLHRHAYTRPYRHQCDICFQFFKRFTMLKAHRQTQHPNELKIKNPKNEPVDGEGIESKPKMIWACEICGKQCSGRVYLLQHIRSHEQKVCVICDAMFKTKVELQEHILKGHQVKEEPAEEIPVDIPNEIMIKLEPHIDIQEGAFPNEEPVQKEEKQTMLTQNVLSTRKRRLLKCSKCSKRFTYGSDLLAHLKIHKSAKTSKPAKCHICGKACTNQRYLHQHMQIHSRRL